MDQIDRLVPVEADAMAGTVRQAGQPVVGAIAEAGVEAAYGVVDGTRRHPDLRGGERDLLTLRDPIPDGALLARRALPNTKVRDTSD